MRTRVAVLDGRYVIFPSGELRKLSLYEFLLVKLGVKTHLKSRYPYYD